MSKWALILGASTGHGGATAISLAEKGYGIIGFHFDRGETKKEAEKTISKVNELNGGLCHYWNTNAASEQAMDKYIPEIKKIVGDGHLKLFLHSIAFGTTTNFFGETPVTQRQMDMTVHVMGNSLLYWTQKLFEQKLIGEGSRITANAIQAGITPTRALTKITDRWETWVENTKKRNPMRRTTTPNDVANTVKLLLETEADFINCSIIYCDGGEHRSGSF